MSLNYYRFAYVVLFLMLFPSIATAQCAGGASLCTILVVVMDILALAAPFIIGLVVVFFLWGATKYILAGDNAEARAMGRQFMIYGIVTLFVAISLWGLVLVLQNTFVSPIEGSSIRNEVINLAPKP